MPVRWAPCFISACVWLSLIATLGSCGRLGILAFMSFFRLSSAPLWPCWAAFPAWVAFCALLSLSVPIVRVSPLMIAAESGPCLCSASVALRSVWLSSSSASVLWSASASASRCLRGESQTTCGSLRLVVEGSRFSAAIARPGGASLWSLVNAIHHFGMPDPLRLHLVHELGVSSSGCFKPIIVMDVHNFQHRSQLGPQCDSSTRRGKRGCSALNAREGRAE